jgi:hypothetical protein
MDPLFDYPNFAIQRAVGLYEQLDKSKITPSDFVSDFFNDREFYKSLDPQKYKDAKPSFIFLRSHTRSLHYPYQEGREHRASNL